MNNRLEILDYEIMKLEEVGTVTVELMLFAASLIFSLLLCVCNVSFRSFFAWMWQKMVIELVLWGTVINIMTVNYLPLLTSTFMCVIGMQWEDIDLSELFINLLILFLLCLWLSFPVVIYFAIVRER